MIVPRIPRKNFIKSNYNKSSQLSSSWAQGHFIFSGSEALILALSKMNISKSDKILLPSYICNSVTKTLFENGYSYVFADVDKNMILSLDTITSIIDKNKIKVVMLVDYFGFYSEENLKIARNLRNKKINIILDRCHSSFTKRDLISDVELVDAIILSFRKTIPVYDGGYLITNNFEENIQLKVHYFNLNSFIFTLRNLIEKIIYLIGFPNIYSNFINKFRTHLFEFKNKLMKRKQHINYSQSALSSDLLLYLNSDWKIKQITNIRILNYKMLAKKVSNLGVGLFQPELDKYTCPQVLPIIDKKGDLYDLFIKNKVGVYRWPDDELPEEIKNDILSYPNTNYFNQALVLLPIHQDMCQKHFDRIIALIKKR